MMFGEQLSTNTPPPGEAWWRQHHDLLLSRRSRPPPRAEKDLHLLQEETGAAVFWSNSSTYSTYNDHDFTGENRGGAGDGAGTSLEEASRHLERVSLDKDDDLKRRASSKGVVVRHLLSAPALLLHGVAHHARRPVEPRVEVESYVSPRLDAAATGEVHLEPGRQARGAAGTPPTHGREAGLGRSPVNISRNTSLDQNHFSRTESSQEGPSEGERLWGEEQADVLTADYGNFANLSTAV